jgi:peptidoglycan glycosyltransferase
MSPNGRLKILGTLSAVLLILLSLRIGDWQMLRGPSLLPAWLNPSGSTSGAPQGLTDLNDLPQPVLQRTAGFLSQVSRGSIYDRNGQLLASDRVDANGNRTRFYSQPALAPILGYTSAYRTGLVGLEQTYNTSLLGLDRLDTRLAELLHQPLAGSDLVLTIDSRLQTSADRALAGKAGAVIVMDAHSGAVLAMASAPRFDPNRVLDPGYAAGLTAACGGAPACRAPFINRATQALYPPGSTFKTITLIAGLDTGQLDPKMVFDFGKPVTGPSGSYYVYHVTGGGTIVDANHREQRLSLEQSYADSANAAFAKIGDEMPPDVLVSYARRFGFSPDPGKSLPFEIDTSPSQLANSVDGLYSDNMLRASTAIGQGELMATPLTIGEMALAVVNDGSLPVPYLVEAVKDPTGRVIHQHSKQVISGLMKPATAKTVRDMMISVVTSGTGGNASVPGMVVGGKTGTAQVGGAANPHAWFVGFAQAQGREVVIVVVIENGGEGSAAAAPIFAKMAKAALAP